MMDKKQWRAELYSIFSKVGRYDDFYRAEEDNTKEKLQDKHIVKKRKTMTNDRKVK